MKLTERLFQVAQFCKGAHTVIDVGCDHAKLPIYLIEHNWAQGAIATDIRKGPVDTARRNIEKAGLGDKIRAHLCNGLADFTGADGDCVSIAGMGGDEIISILSQAPWLQSTGHVLVLQPQTQEHKVRKYLRETGFFITAEQVAVEGRRIYIVLKAQWQGGRLPCQNFDLFSSCLEQAQHRQLYIQKLISRYQKQLDGCLAQQSQADPALLEQLALLHDTLQRYQP